jgi:small-conductance mechanosensitive channel/CRP-like cAMP-binding protein
VDALATIFAQMRATGTPWALGGLLLTALVVRLAAPEDHRRLRATALFVLLHLALLGPAAALADGDPDTHLQAQVAARFAAALAGIGMVLTLVFKVALPRVGYHAPRILRDVVGTALLVIVVFSMASRLGVHLASLIATSAVVTAVIGLALQDTLGNVIGGLMLQSDRSIEVGDWVRIGETVGRVVDVRWRYTAIETRNWETLIVPNGQIVKNQVLVLGRRKGKPAQWRRLIEFHVDFRFAPTRVIEAVEEAVRQARVPNVADDPAPNCVLMGFHESTARYILRYHLTDLAVDDPTDSAVRVRVYFGLQRAGIPLAIPAQTLFLTQNEGRKLAEAREDEDERRFAIDRIELFHTLPETERHALAEGLRHAPFARGEVMTRQGAEGHWLYLIVRGRVSVRVASNGGGEAEVNQLDAGDFFGETSLMTGERRTATVIALTDVDCYRLDRAVFQAVIQRQPALAEHIARILAERRMVLTTVRDDLDHEAHCRKMEQTRLDFVDRIRAFFGLDEGDDG